MSMAEKAFLGSLIKADYLLKDTVIQPEQLESTRHKELVRRMVELKRAGKNIDLIRLPCCRGITNSNDGCNVEG